MPGPKGNGCGGGMLPSPPPPTATPQEMGSRLPLPLWDMGSGVSLPPRSWGLGSTKRWGPGSSVPTGDGSGSLFPFRRWGPDSPFSPQTWLWGLPAFP